MTEETVGSNPELGKKRCTKCGETKDLSQYSPLRRGNGVFRAMCKVCSATAARLWGREDRAKRADERRAAKEAKRALAAEQLRARRAAATEKLCRSCGQIKPTSEFYPIKSTGGLRPECKVCALARARRWQAENREQCAINIAAWRELNRAHCIEYEEINRERLRESQRRYRRENPDKALDSCHRRNARIRNAPKVEKVSRLVVAERDSWVCHICGKRVTKKNMSIDHLIPLVHGGSHTYDNIALAHLKCNLRRGPGRLPVQLRLF